MSDPTGEDPTKQTVVDDTKGAAKPAPADANAQGDDLDALLSEFETATTDPKVEQPANGKEIDTDSIVRQVRSEIEAENRFEKDMGNAIKIVKGDLPVKERAVRGWLEAYALENEAFRNAWQNRHSNPARFNKVLEKLKPLYAEDVGANIDRSATDTQEAVAAAVRSASQSTPEPKEEFNEAEIRKMNAGQLYEKFPALRKNF